MHRRVTVFLLTALVLLPVLASPSLGQNCNCATTEPSTALSGSTHDAYGGANGFYGIQLLALGGTNYNIHVSDRTYDSAAFGRIQVIDCATGAVIIDQTFDSSIGDFDNPASIDVPVSIPAASFQVTLTAMEFSGSSLWFGDTQFHVGSTPTTSQTITETRCYETVCPCSTFEMASALIGSDHDAYGGANGFYGVQLRALGGSNYNIHVSDRTYDSAAFGRIQVVDCQTGVVLVDQLFDSSIGDFDNPASIDVPVNIPAQFFSVTLTTQEFSGSSVWFGDSQEHVGSTPTTSQLLTATRCYDATSQPVATESVTWGRLKDLYRN
jgi:hypothetical protein